MSHPCLSLWLAMQSTRAAEWTYQVFEKDSAGNCYVHPSAMGVDSVLSKRIINAGARSFLVLKSDFLQVRSLLIEQCGFPESDVLMGIMSAQ